MKYNKQGSVKQKKLAEMHNPDAFLAQMEDTLQASLFRAEDIRAQLCNGQPMVLTATTWEGQLPGDHTVVIETTIEVQTLVEVVSIYVDAYTAYRIKETGNLIDGELLAFLGWLKGIDNPSEPA